MTLPPQDVVDCAAAGAAVLTEARALLEQFSALADVVVWVTRDPAREILDVVVQDEFTHDVVVRWRDDFVLVFDTT